MKERPAVNSTGQKELDKAAEQFKEFDNQIKEMTQDRMNLAPKLDVEPQTKMAQVDIEKSKDIYLKPKRSLGPGVNPKTGARETFNESYREEYNHAKELVQFIAENHEIIGEDIEIWTKPFAGMNCEFWQVPTNKPVWGPRYLAEQIKRKYYHRLIMKNNVTEQTGVGQMYGQIAADTTVQRLDARPASTGRKSIFMGAHSF